MTRFPILAVLVLAAILVGPPLADAQTPDVPKGTNIKPPRDTRTRTSTAPRGKTPVSGSVYIGDDAPSFELEGSNGRAVKHSSLRGEWVVLAFSDRWRPIADLDVATDRLRRIGSRIVGVCHEKQQTLLTAAKRDSVKLLLLADPTGEVSGLYGMFDWGRSQTQTGFFVLDRTGVVRLAVLGRIFPPDQIFDTVEFLKGAYQATN